MHEKVDLEFVEAGWMYRFIDPCRILALGYFFVFVLERCMGYQEQLLRSIDFSLFCYAFYVVYFIYIFYMFVQLSSL